MKAANAIRNLQFLCDYHGRDEKGYEKLSDVQPLDRSAIESTIGESAKFNMLFPYIGNYRRIPHPDEQRMEVWETRQNKRKKKVERFSMAVFGAFMLIAPMLIMSIHQSRLKSLLTSCLFVIFVALGLAQFSTATNQEVLGATAAYAAVMVVFVGSTAVP